ncbi:MAG: glycosyltransferase family 2 protein [Gammaproteobacteria bacterium]|nr:glycosyltransferase family 2 protein [Gammaproteobacteria bacterium]
MDDVQLSVIVPLYNEEACVKALYQAITNALEPLDITYEILFVDDGSKDNTVAESAKLVAHDNRLRIVKFRRNYGQTPAMAAGIDNARGKILVTMDGDLQNDPSDIPHFLKKMEEGYDIVVGWRHKRQDKLITRKIPSMIANRLIGKITGVPIKDNGCSLKAYKADVIKNIPLYSEMHRFIPAMASLAGTRVAEIKVKHHARQFGESKYGLSRIFKVLVDLITIKSILSFYSKPLALFTLVAFVSAILGAGIIGLAVTENNGHFSVIYASTAFLYFTLSAILLVWGILGELIFFTGETKQDFFAQIKHSVQK